MVRTSGGIRITAGKSSKKSGGGGSSGGGSRSTSSTSGGKSSSSKGSSRLPPIPHCEAPAWQKPITNFFIAGTSSKNESEDVLENKETEAGSSNLKNEAVEILQSKENLGSSDPDGTEKSIIEEVTQKISEENEKSSEKSEEREDVQLKKKRRIEEESGKENVDISS